MELESQRNIHVQTPEEFLKLVNPTILSLQSLEDLKKSLETAEQIGEESGIGAVYTLDDKVVKISHYCRPKAGELLSRMCKMAKEGDYIFRIPDTFSHKQILLAPNYFVEPLIGRVVYSATKDFTPSFMRVDNFYWDPPSSYTITEKLDLLPDFIRTEWDYLYYLFQIVWALKTAQQTNRFVHYDLHVKNMMARPTDSRITRITSYPLPNGKWLYTAKPFDAVIIDYGHSRGETQNFVLSPRLIFKIGARREQIDYYHFNPFYDVFTLLYDNYKKMGNRYPKWPTAVPNGETITETLLESFLNGAKLSDVLITPTGWRPWPEALAEERTLTPTEMLVQIADLLGDTPENQAETVLKERGIVVIDKLVSTPEQRYFFEVPFSERQETVYYTYSHNYDTPERFSGVEIQTSTGVITGVRDTIAPFNHTLLGVYDGFMSIVIFLLRVMHKWI